MESDSEFDDILGDLLANAADPDDPAEPPKKEVKKAFNFLDAPTNVKPTDDLRLRDDGGPSLVHDADLDSSDEEDRRNFEDQQYTDSGRALKNLLKKDPTETQKTSLSGENFLNRPPISQSSQKSAGFDFNASSKVASSGAAKADNGYFDPIFGLKLVKPVISSYELKERMRSRTPVTVSRVKGHLATQNLSDDWVIAGVVINRSTTKTSQKGSQFCIWKLSDLGEKMSTVSLFLHSGAYKLFWKTTTGTVVGIMNPVVLDSRDDTDQATLAVYNAQQIMVFGNSPDMAKCKSTTKSGQPCGNIVNLSRCEYCVYHVKQEYNKASRRADIQSNASGRGFSSSLAPKSKAPLAGIYAQGGQTFTPVFAKRNEKLYQKDSATLALLRGSCAGSARPAAASPKTEKPERKAASVELTTHQTKKDLEKLNKLRGWNAEKQMSFVSPSQAASLSSTPSAPKSCSTPAKTTSALPKSNSTPGKNSPVPKTNSTPGKNSPLSESNSTPGKNSSLPKTNSTPGKNSSLPKTNSTPGKNSSLQKSNSTLEKNSSLPKSNSTLGKNSTLSKTNSAPGKNTSTGEKSSPAPSLSTSPPTLSIPRLGNGIKGGSIDFSQPITKQHANSVRLNAARFQAARWVKENCGALKASDPNKIRESKSKIQAAGAKRRREADEADAEVARAAKKAASGVNDKFRELLEAKSAHVDLVEKSQDEEQEKYFEKLETRERMEEKMLTTFKVDCKAVKCIVCRYTAFSASDLCKEQRHPLRVIDATKSFFKCADCGNRTVSLDRIPSHTCKKCQGSHWVRAAMMAEKRTEIAGAKLSIRGGEETFIGSVSKDANLDLLVPDSGT